jgi:hypothetical protein
MVVLQFFTLAKMFDLWEMAKLMALEEWTIKGDRSYTILYITPVEKFEQYLSYCTANDQLIPDIRLFFANALLVIFIIGYLIIATMYRIQDKKMLTPD